METNAEGNKAPSPDDNGDAVPKRAPNSDARKISPGDPSETKAARDAGSGETSLPGADQSAANPFDPARLRLSSDLSSAAGVRKVVTTVPCRKPNRHEFVRVRPGDEWRLETGVFEDKIHRETYLVEPELWPELLGEIFPVCLFTAITRQGDLFLWPVKLPGADGRSNAWNESAFAAAKLAEAKWVRVAANMSAGMYDVFAAEGDLSDPEWPPLPLEELLKLSFKDRFIRSTDHPVIKILRGEV